MLPAKLAAATAVVALTTSEIEALEGGRPVTRLLDAAGDDMVMFGAVWIDAPATDYLRAMHDIESLECGGGFTITKRLSAPPTVEDFRHVAAGWRLRDYAPAAQELWRQAYRPNDGMLGAISTGRARALLKPQHNGYEMRFSTVWGTSAR